MNYTFTVEIVLSAWLHMSSKLHEPHTTGCTDANAAPAGRGRISTLGGGVGASTYAPRPPNRERRSDNSSCGQAQVP